MRDKVELSHYMYLSFIMNLPMVLVAAVMLEKISFTDPFDPSQIVHWCRKHSAQRAKLPDQALGQRFGIPARPCCKEQDLQHFIVSQSARTTIDQARAQSLTMAQRVWR